ncbi:hypothetical protein BCR34DRAFT_57179 [Clohesyomyces aquaticus]|uniref:BZIP domain-containing protein n=1 Tax=Clohesyomyces aquaticus TaxID=1231657 RepID=A0A1Y1Z2Q6_9PLEO|nr:hypothetical protein BCR34DRAFT_57179 [Clohesyomyces aquaticus]
MDQDTSTNIDTPSTVSARSNTNSPAEASPSQASPASPATAAAARNRIVSITPAPRLPGSSFPAGIATTPTASFSAPGYASSSLMGGGPTSRSHVVPPRPKPGRKPATDEPASKRKAQNRESQRAFRARKAAKLNEMQARVETAEERHRREMDMKIMEVQERDAKLARLEQDMKQQREAIKCLTNERDFWIAKVKNLDAQLVMLQQQTGTFQPGTPRNDSAVNPLAMPQPVWSSQNALQEAINRSANHSPASWPSQNQHQAPLSQSSAGSPTWPSHERRPGSSNQSIHSPIQPLTTTTDQTMQQDYATPPTLNSGGCGNCDGTGNCACMEAIEQLPSPNTYMPPVPLKRNFGSPFPNSGLFAEREIDFTAQWVAKRGPSNSFLGQSEADSKCGFCTDDANCLCKDQSLRNFTETTAPQSQNWNMPLPNDNNMPSGPGSCADCLQNPQQRAWCQGVAQSKRQGTNKTDSDNQTNGPHDYSIGCSDAFKLLEGRVPTTQDGMDWSALNPIPAVQTGMPPVRTYSALELDTAGVIATLQQSMAPIIPRASDGQNNMIVNMARANQIAAGRHLNPGPHNF